MIPSPIPSVARMQPRLASFLHQDSCKPMQLWIMKRHRPIRSRSTLMMAMAEVIASVSPSTLQMSLSMTPCSRMATPRRGLLRRTPVEAPTSEAPVAATDANTGDTLTYTLGGTDAGSFSIVSTSGQLRTNATLDYETKSSYTVTVEVSDGTGGSDSITVTINVTDVEETTITPVKDRTTQVRDAIVAAVPNVSDADDVTEAHLAAITELNLQSKSITALKAGDFSGLTGLETLYLNHASANANAKNSISDISPLAGLTTLTRLHLSDNLISDISVLSGMTSMKALYLDNNSISDISALSGLTSMTTLDLRNNNVTDVSPLSGMTTMFVAEVAGNPISDYATLRTLQASHSLWGLDISLNNNPPTFTDGATTTRSVAENTAAGQNIGAAVAATDADNHTLSYTLGGTDADSFSIVSTSGQLQTKAALDYETKEQLYRNSDCL